MKRKGSFYPDDLLGKAWRFSVSMAEKAKRRILRAGHEKLSEIQAVLLEEIDIKRSRRIYDRYDTMLEEYKAYIGEHGDNLVFLAYVTPDGISLGKWLRHKRTK